MSLGEVPSTVNQRMDGRTVYVNKATRTENSAMDHATKQRSHVCNYIVYHGELQHNYSVLAARLF